MKVCPNCGAEYQDQDAYCSKCGTKLDATNVCQKCGYPVSTDEVFCRHCGHQIEKEYRCESCGAVVEETAKFCPNCGAKNENPVIAIKKADKTVKKSDPTQVAGLVNKILFWAVGGTLLFLFVLMFIGCFGDILSINIRGMASETAGSSLMNGEYTRSIKYFFGEGAKQIRADSENLKNGGYEFFATMMLVFETLAWIGAIIAIIISAIFLTINFVKGPKKDFKLRTKPFFVASGFVAHYLFLIALQNIVYMEVTDRPATYARTWNVDLTFGWGTSMMLVAIVLGFVTIIAFKILKAIFEKKDIVKTSVLGGLVLILIITLMTNLGQVVGLDYSATSSMTSDVSGTTSVFNCYTNSLYSYSANAIKEVPGYAVQCLFGSLFILVGYALFLELTKALLNKKKGMVVGTSIASFLCLIIGHVMAAVGASESVADSNYYGYTYSAAGVLLPLFAIAALVGYLVLDSIKSKPQQVQQA